MHATCVASDVSFELAVVAERHVAVRAAESLGPLLLAGRGGRRGADGRERVDRLQSSQLVQLADVAGAHAESGEARGMKSFWRGFQRGEEALHGRGDGVERLLVHRLREVNARTERHPGRKRGERELVAEHQVVRVSGMNGREIGRGRFGSDADPRQLGLVRRGGARRRSGRRAGQALVLFLEHRRRAVLAGIGIPRTEDFVTARNQRHVANRALRIGRVVGDECCARRKFPSSLYRRALPWVGAEGLVGGVNPRKWVERLERGPMFEARRARGWRMGLPRIQPPSRPSDQLVGPASHSQPANGVRRVGDRDENPRPAITAAPARV